MHGIDAQVFGDRLHVWVPADEPGGFLAALKDRPPAAQDRPPDAERFSTLLPGSQIRTITPSLEDVYIARMTELRP